MIGLDEWIAQEARFAASAMSGAISATHLVKDRPGFGQSIVPRPGSVLASPVLAAYDPDPDYFFHWFRDSAIVIDALRVALAEGFADGAAVVRFEEFVEFSLSLRSLDGREFLRQGDFRHRVQPSFLRYVRPDTEIAAVFAEAALAEARVNPDGALDFIRWARPQADGPALRILALLRWRRQMPDLGAPVRSAVRGTRRGRSGVHAVARARTLLRHLGRGERASLLHPARAGGGARARRRMARGDRAGQPGPRLRRRGGTKSSAGSTRCGTARRGSTARASAWRAATRARSSISPSSLPCFMRRAQAAPTACSTLEPRRP